MVLKKSTLNKKHKLHPCANSMLLAFREHVQCKMNIKFCPCWQKKQTKPGFNVNKYRGFFCQ